MSEKTFPWKYLIGALVVAGLFAAWFFLPVKEWMQQFNAWVESRGALGVVVFGLVYIVGTVLMMPGGVLTIAAGLAFGLWAFPLVVVAASIGAALAFLVARYLARDRLVQRYGDGAKFKAIDDAVADEGWKIVALLRLSPLIPFNVQNYLYGLTAVNFVPYLLATFFFIMPGTLLYVYLGAAGKLALSGGGEASDGGSTLQWIFFGLGLLATIIVTVIVTRKARAKLKETAVGSEELESESAD